MNLFIQELVLTWANLVEPSEQLLPATSSKYVTVFANQSTKLRTLMNSVLKTVLRHAETITLTP
jgi:hypothetical protein